MRSLDHPFGWIATAGQRFRRDRGQSEGLHETFDRLIGRQVLRLTCRPVDHRSPESSLTIPGVEASYRLLHQLTAEDLIQRVQSFLDFPVGASRLHGLECLLHAVQPLAKSLTLIVYRSLLRGKFRDADLLQDILSDRLVIELHRFEERLQIASAPVVQNPGNFLHQIVIVALHLIALADRLRARCLDGLDPVSLLIQLADDRFRLLGQNALQLEVEFMLFVEHLVLGIGRVLFSALAFFTFFGAFFFIRFAFCGTFLGLFTLIGLVDFLDFLALLFEMLV